ncbi:hypothetical protein NDU88_002902 [Pleurodeles waltl]|uniref:Uncharacterized protein n=1 Tax=Pleurodeles waltl TaxID=8319 RepID=A0AAV7MP07_PLEWA|nr:hypothetical protein NDU88_002902 [Pleurodeles waltl]
MIFIRLCFLLEDKSEDYVVICATKLGLQVRTVQHQADGRLANTRKLCVTPKREHPSQMIQLPSDRRNFTFFSTS